MSEGCELFGAIRAWHFRSPSQHFFFFGINTSRSIPNQSGYKSREKGKPRPGEPVNRSLCSLQYSSETGCAYRRREGLHKCLPSPPPRRPDSIHVRLRAWEAGEEDEREIERYLEASRRP